MCNNGDVQYFCHMTEGTAKALFDFSRHKILPFSKQTILSHKETLYLLPSFSHQHNF